jgi:hypothetical protein
MHRLDHRTLQRVATLLCDVDGPFERHGWQLEEFLRAAGWKSPPPYDGSARVRWAHEVLSDHADDLLRIEQVLQRLCDPLEYDDGVEAAEIIRAEVNRILHPEGLMVALVSGRPVVGELSDGDGAPRYSAPERLEERLSQLISDRDAVALLLARAGETVICESHGAYVFAVIGIGSFVEGLLFAVLNERDSELRADGYRRPRGGQRVSFERLGLSDLIDISHGKGWVQLDAKDFLRTVRDYRDFVHPRRQLDSGMTPDSDTVMMCWGPALAVLNDLERALPPLDKK